MCEMLYDRYHLLYCYDSQFEVLSDEIYDSSRTGFGGWRE
jgi:hypothetical protein